MLDFCNVTVTYGARDVLADVSFRINPRERVGIVGPNGAGKTTIFGLIAGELTPDRGDVQVAREVRLGYLRQQLRPADRSLSVLDFSEDALDEVREMQHEIEAIEARLAESADDARARDLRRLGELQTAFEHLGGYDLRRRASAGLCGLGFAPADLHRPLGEFSGGWQMRAELVRALVARPDLLLLDEPTNYLDLPAVEWLQRHLRDFEGTLLLASHDRFLLNTLTSATLEVVGGRVTRFEGPYAFYVEERRRRFEQADATRAAQARRREHIERFVERFRYKATKAGQVQSRIKMLERMDPVEDAPPPAARAGGIRLAPPPPCGAEVMRLEQAGVTYDGQIWVLRGLDLSVGRGDKVALVGYNGMGKTTLLRLLAGQLEPTEGRRRPGHNVVVGYQAQDFAELMDPERTVLETVKAAGPGVGERDLRTLLGGFLFRGDDVDKRVAVLSGGERMRLAFARLLVRPPNFLLLDEPTTHLDISAREALEAALVAYEGTLYLVSHDIEFVRRVAGRILAMAPPGVRAFAGGYDYYREKTEAEAAASAPGAPASAPVPGDRKALRRERARQREENRQVRGPLVSAVREAEKRIADLEREQAELAAALERPEGGDYAAVSAVSRRLAEIEAELPRQLEAWEAAGRALQALDADGQEP